MRMAEAGIAELQSVVNTLLSSEPELFRVANEKDDFRGCIPMADQVLYSGVAL